MHQQQLQHQRHQRRQPSVAAGATAHSSNLTSTTNMGGGGAAGLSSLHSPTNKSKSDNEGARRPASPVGGSELCYFGGYSISSVCGYPIQVGCVSARTNIICCGCVFELSPHGGRAEGGHRSSLKCAPPPGRSEGANFEGSGEVSALERTGTCHSLRLEIQVSCLHV